MLIGREREQKRLLEAYHSEYSELVAVYGRRRVGKTFLIRETFDYKFTFQHTGIGEEKKSMQLKAWKNSLHASGLDLPVPRTWMDAFEQLKELISRSRTKRKVIFIDELPWMDTRSSGLLPALEWFWNGWCTSRKDIVLIICGSSSSWITKKILKNKGGLHNRVGFKIPLRPFTLHECEAYATYRKLGMNRKQLMEAYMAFGGVPFYWKALERGKSLAQNIDHCIFDPDGELHDEFDALYKSLFKRPEPYIKVVELLASRRYGYSRLELLERGKFVDNGQFSEVLKDLESCGFIRSYNILGHEKKEAIYQLTDPYSVFYYNFIAENRQADPQFWSHNYNSPLHSAWCGLGFERVCMLHIDQLRKALGISGTVSTACCWRSRLQKGGAQIDLMLDRNDGIMDVCEMKYTSAPLVLEAEDEEARLRRERLLREESVTDKAIHHVLVSANGVKQNSYSNEYANIIDGESLFELA